MEIKILAISWRSNIERALSLTFPSLHQLWQFLRTCTILQHFLQYVGMLQQHIPRLEAAHFEIETPADSLVNCYDTIGNLLSMIGSVDERICRRLASQFSSAIISFSSLS